MATLTYEYQKFAETYLGSNNYGGVYLRLYAKLNSQSIPNNASSVTYKSTLYIERGSAYCGTTTTKGISGNGISTYSDNATGTYQQGETILYEKTGTTRHGGDGTNTITPSCSFRSTPWGWNGTASASITVPTIPRYVNITSFTVNKRDETSVTYNYSTDANTDYAKYSTDNGSTWHDLPTNNIVSGLNANTTYNFKLQVRRQDSQLWTTSNTVQQTTYDYPHCTEAPNFTIGNNVTINLYNPLNRTVQIQMWSHKSTQFVSDLISISGTSYTGFANVSSRLYASIPNDTSSVYNIDVWYGTNKAIKTGGTYSINANECKPIFSNFEFYDFDNTILPLTNNDQILVNENSDCMFKISTVNKAVGKNSASITKYICYWGNSSNEVAYSDSNDVTQYICDSTGGVLKVTAVDSRGLTTTVTKNITYIPYVSAVINNLETQRKDGVDAKTFLKGKITLFGGSWNASSDITSINRLKYVGYSVYINNVWSEYYDITSEVLNKATVSTSGNNKIYEFDFDDEIELHANGSSGGFTVGTEYQIKFLIKDGNSATIFTPYSYQALYEFHVTDGTVATCVHKGNNGKYHFGINCMSDNNYMIVVNNKPLIDNNGNLCNRDYFSGIIQNQHWYYIGDFNLENQGRYAVINCYTGNGQNGSASQNTYIQILLKQGWTGDAKPIGVTAKFFQNYSSDYKIKIKHNSLTTCSLYIYLPFYFNDLTYNISGSYVEFINKGEVLDNEPTTDKEAEYYQ